MYLVEYGAGFFVDLKANDAIDFYSRKVSLIKEKSVKLSEIINEKREALKHIQMRLMLIMQQMQQNQAKK